MDRLGYVRRNGRWRHGEPTRQIVFLGDFIDRGPDSGRVLETVRDLIADGRALAVMGNHELNAFHYHNRDPESGEWLRAHSEKNREQHGAFLNEFPCGSAGAREWTGWMAGLPLWLDLGPFRVVHACWDVEVVRRLARIAPGGVLPRDDLLEAGRWRSEDDRSDLNRDVETLTKGPEAELPRGHGFKDKSGHERRRVRIAWWKSDARNWRDAAMSVPHPDQLPDEPLPDTLGVNFYAAHEKPVFFGHYWLSAEARPTEPQAPNALCLDFSAGLEEHPLVAYAWEPGSSGLSVEAISGGRWEGAPALDGARGGG